MLVGVVAVLLFARLARATGSRGAATGRRPSRQVVAALCGVAGLAWFVVIAIMTQIGFSGNNRYLVHRLGAGGDLRRGRLGLGRRRRSATSSLGARAPRPRRPPRGGEPGAGRGRRSRWSALVFVLLPSWVGNNLIYIPRTHRSLVYQAHLRQGVTELVADYGGAGQDAALRHR